MTILNEYYMHFVYIYILTINILIQFLFFIFVSIVSLWFLIFMQRINIFPTINVHFYSGHVLY